MYKIYNIQYRDYIRNCKIKSIKKKSKQPNMTIDRGYAQTVHNRGNRKGQYTHGKRLNVFGNQRHKH